MMPDYIRGDKHSTLRIITGLLAIGLLAGCGHSQPQPTSYNNPAPPPPVASGRNNPPADGSRGAGAYSVANGARRQSVDNSAVGTNFNANAPIMPDASRTPGDALDVTSSDVCVSGYSSKVRDVPQAVKEQVYASYGITSRQPKEYEIDHLIPLSMGGSNSVRNLWPQSFRTKPWNATVKDGLENRLHNMICKGQIDMKTAQHEIAADWIGAYKKYFHTDLPTNAKSNSDSADGNTINGASGGAPSDRQTPQTGQVWVNTNSGKYFQPGAKYYGKTSKGQYMSEADAIKQGYVAAKDH